jgi:hypothetical protein
MKIFFWTVINTHHINKFLETMMINIVYHSIPSHCMIQYLLTTSFTSAGPWEFFCPGYRLSTVNISGTTLINKKQSKKT